MYASASRRNVGDHAPHRTSVMVDVFACIASVLRVFKKTSKDCRTEEIGLYREGIAAFTRWRWKDSCDATKQTWDQAAICNSQVTRPAENSSHLLDLYNSLVLSRVYISIGLCPHISIYNYVRMNVLLTVYHDHHAYGLRLWATIASRLQGPCSPVSTIPPRRSHVHIVRPEFLDSVHFAGQFQGGEKLVPDCMEHRPWHVPRAVRHTLHGRQPGLIGQCFSHHSEHPAPPWAISLGGKALVLLLRSCSSYSMAIVSSKDRRPGQKVITYKFCTLVALLLDK